MAILAPLAAKVLATRMIASVAPALASQLKLPAGCNSVGLISSDCDDVTYIALDQATKSANVQVIYGHSFYAGANHASGPTSGEVIGVIAGPGPDDIRAGIASAKQVIEHEVCFRSANEAEDIAFLSHVVSSSGEYFAAEYGVEKGTSLAYLIAPPVEAIYAIDAACKAATVEMVCYVAPPSETNFAGAIFSGDHAACQAACDAFTQAVLECADAPLQI